MQLVQGSSSRHVNKLALSELYYRDELTLQFSVTHPFEGGERAETLKGKKCFETKQRQDPLVKNVCYWFLERHGETIGFILCQEQVKIDLLQMPFLEMMHVY